MSFLSLFPTRRRQMTLFYTHLYPSQFESVRLRPIDDPTSWRRAERIITTSNTYYIMPKNAVKFTETSVYRIVHRVDFENIR